MPLPVDCNLSKIIIILSNTFFVMNVVNQGGERVWEGDSKSGSIPVIPGHLSYMGTEANNVTC